VGNKLETTVTGGPTENDHETFYPNVFMGLESHVNSWLTLRFGAQNAALYSLKSENNPATPNPTTIKTHVFDFNMGAPLNLGSLMLDATRANGFWNSPIGAVFNTGVGNQPFPRVSATSSF